MFNSSSTPAMVASKVPPIPMYVAEIGKEIALLKDELYRFADRLSMVVVPAETGAEPRTENKMPERHSPVAMELHDHYQQLHLLTMFLQDLQGHLEV